MKFLDIFNEIEKGNYALTDEAVYSSLQNGDELIPLYGGNREHTTVERTISISAKTKKNQAITIFDQEGIIISLDGSAGCMTYKKGERFALNHHAGFITLKDGSENVVCLEYFAIFFQNHYKSLAVSDGSKTLSLQQIYSEDFSIPGIEEQRRAVAAIKTISSKVKALCHLKKIVERLLLQDIVYDADDIVKRAVSLDTMARIIQGHQITDEEIYNQKGDVPIFTGPNDIKGYWEKAIIDCTDLPCLTYATKAFDGTITIQRSLFDANNTAVLIIKDEYKSVVEIEWLQAILPNLFLKNATSKEGVSYLNKAIVQNITIDIPKHCIQKKCIERHKQLSDLQVRINRLIQRYNTIITKEIVFN